MRPAFARAPLLACLVALAALASPGAAGFERPARKQPVSQKRLVKGRAKVEMSQAPAGVAFRVVDLVSGETLAEARPDILARRSAPGSVAKLATLVAALESRVVDASTRLECPGEIVVEGRRLACVHPAFHRPLTAAEALAHSCNAWFAAVARRVPRGAFDRVLVRMGLAPSDASVPMGLAAIGLAGVDQSPSALLDALVKVATRAGARPGDRGNVFDGDLEPEYLEIVRRGLRLAALEGTASALGESGFDALAKTGTAPTAGGGYQGLAVALTPAENPDRAIVAVVAGGAGRDAAAVAADLLERHGPRPRPNGLSSALPPSVRIGRLRGTTYQAEEIRLEEYVAAVVAGEAAPGTPRAALDALAITARTYAVANLGRHAADGFDLCDLTHCQVVARPTQAARRAAEGTAGLVLAYAGKPASVFYTASCGGISERAASVWPAAIDRPYIVERVDPLCRKDPGWTTELSVEQLSRALGAAGLRGKRVTDLRVAARTPSGRVALLSVSGFAPSEIGGDSFRLAVGRTAGWQVLKSASFDVARTAGGYRFTGRGAGHGVGLCLAGATRMARLGHTSASILSEYFPGTRVMGAKTGGTSLGDRREASSPGAGSSEQATGSTLETPGTRVEMRLQAGDEDERRAIAGLVRRALDSLSRALDVPLPPRVRLTFHPSAASYQRATGQPWWTSGASRRSEVDLIPLTNLRSRGTLEETLRHEIVHVLTSDLLVNRPAWVREGLAIHFAGEAAGAPPRHRAAPVSCPTDEDLLRSRSAASLEQAYRRAASCVARALASGISWRDIR